MLSENYFLLFEMKIIWGENVVKIIRCRKCNEKFETEEKNISRSYKCTGSWNANSYFVLHKFLMGSNELLTYILDCQEIYEGDLEGQNYVDNFARIIG